MKVGRFVILCSIALMLLCPVFAVALKRAKIAFVSNVDGWGIDIMNPDGSMRKKLIKHSGGLNQLAWSPSGEQILFGARNTDGKHDIYIVNSDGTEHRQLFQTLNYKREPAWSPDGEKIAYMAYSKIWESWSIFVATTDGNFVSPLIRIDQRGGDPAWSPDGTEIAYVDAEFQKREIYIYDIITQQQRLLISSEQSWMKYPTWSPDGKKIAFYWSKTDSERGIYTVNRDGTELKQVAEIVRTGIRSLTWSPNGNQLLYVHPIDDHTHLFKVNILTGKTQQLTQEGYNIDAIWYDPNPMSVFPSDSQITTTWGTIKSRK